MECHNFIKNTYFNLYNKNHIIDTDCSSVYLQSNGRPFVKINIRYISVNFIPFPKFYQDVPHKINHVFQQYKERHTYGDAIKYAQYAEDFRISNNQNIHNVAMLIYNLNPTEQDLFITSVYNYVKHEYAKYELAIDDILKNTEAYENILKCKELFNEIKNNKETYYDIVITRYNFKSWNIFIRRMKSLLQRYERKFSMVSTKCKRDFVLYETHTFFSGDYRKFYLLK